MNDISHTAKLAIEAAISDSSAQVAQVSPGHFTVQVSAQAFAGKTPLQQQRMVLSAIAHLMKGDGAPIHAIDKITAVVP